MYMKILSFIITAAVMLSAMSFCAYAAPDVSAVSAIVINADTGSVIYEKNADERRAMASTTKIMTALLTIEAGDLDRKFAADSMAIRVEGTSMGLREGDIVTRRALAAGMLLPSGNDAANAAAVNISGSIGNFAKLMNKRAAQIGMKNTNFVTPSGLDADGHYTTARDMALLTAEALRNEVFADICGRQYMTVEFGAPLSKRTLYNSNKMLRLYDGCTGVKTGFTDNARRCLVTSAERGGTRLIAVTLNAPDDWDDHAAMLDYGFSQLTPYRIDTSTYAVDVIGGESETISASADGITIGLTAAEKQQIKLVCSIPQFIYADVKKGDKIGTAQVYCGEKVIASIDINALESCARKVPEKNFFENIWSNLWKK